MQLNNYTLVDRHNRPTTMQRVGLRTIFVNDGLQVNPVGISAVSIFAKADITTIFDTTAGTSGMGLVQSEPLMQFSNITNGVVLSATTNAAFDTTGYTPGITASGIYKSSATTNGEFMVVLDGAVSLSGMWEGSVIPNGASSVADYIDVWTVKLAGGSQWQTLINEFSLYGDTFFTITEPLILTARNSSPIKHVELGSKIKLKVPTEITVENKSIDGSITDIFKGSAVTSGAFEIQKLNDGIDLTPRVTVSAFADTSSLVQVTSDDTFIFTWDTSNLQTILNSTTGGGPATGTYTLRVRYNLVDEIIYSPRFPFIVS